MRKRGFTLIEILVVLAIIAILAAILFPAFKRAREGGYQASCASNLKQIYLAVKLYKDDEARYPSSLGFLLPQQAAGDKSNLVDYSGTPTPVTAGVANVSGSGHLKSTAVLTCPDDENAESSFPRSSYGDISTDIGAGPQMSNLGQVDGGRFVWNYWGYQFDPNLAGTSFLGSNDVQAAITAHPAMTALLVNPGSAYSVTGSPTNPIKRSLSNRYAPEDTVITHCIFHRTSSANVPENVKLYDPGTSSDDRKGARDIIIRLDGHSEVLDVSTFDQPVPPSNLSLWQTQNFR